MQPSEAPSGTWRALLVLMGGVLAFGACDRAKENSSASTTVEEAPLVLPTRGDRARAQQFLERAFRLRERGRMPQAREQVDRALDLDPSFLEARILRANIAMEEGATFDLLAALEDARIAALLAPAEPRVALAEGLIRFHLGQSDSAKSLLERFLASPVEPGSERLRASAEEALGQIALRGGDLSAARRHLEEAVRLHPLRPQSRYALAMVAAESGELAAETRCLEESLRLDPHFLPARMAKARFLRKQGDAEKAEQEDCICEVLRRLKDSTGLEFQEDHAGKAELWRQLSVLLPGDVGSRLQELRELALAGQFALLEERGSAWLTTSEFPPEAVHSVATAQARQGKRGEALRSAERLKHATPPGTTEMQQSLSTEIERLLSGKESEEER